MDCWRVFGVHPPTFVSGAERLSFGQPPKVHVGLLWSGLHWAKDFPQAGVALPR